MWKPQELAKLCFVAVRQTELADLENSAIFRQQANDCRFAMLRGHRRDPHIDVRSCNPQMRGAILRQPALGDVQSGENLDARDQGLRQHVGRRRNHAQQTVDPHTQRQGGAERFDMDVRRPQLHGFVQEIVHGAHDRGTTGEVAQALDIVIEVGEDCLALFWSGLGVAAKPLGEDGGDVFE